MFGKKKIGIALSGGAARGLAHIGVLDVLDDLGVKIEAVSGCSMGAIVGAVYSLGVSLEEVEDYIKSTDWRAFLMFSMFSLSRKGIINERKIEEVLKRFLGDRTFDDCRIRFNCVAVDIVKGKKVVISEGRLIDAVRASIAVPGIFPPICKDDMLLVDGGIMEPLPTEALGMLGVNFKIASSIIFESDNTGQIKSGKQDITDDLSKNIKKMSIQTILDKSMCLIQTEITKSYIKKANVLIEPKIGDYGFFDFIKGVEIITSGRKAAKEKILEIKRKLRIK